jgi:peptide/nickel transport system ATP-binding protein
VIADELDEARALGDRVLVMHDGLVAGDGALDEVLDSPWHPYTTGLVRARTMMTERGA